MSNTTPRDIEKLMTAHVMPELNRRLAGGAPSDGPLIYYYNDISRQEQTGQTIAYPCVFRLLRTETEYRQGVYSDGYVFKETFVFCEKAHTDPGAGTEPPMEQRLLERIRVFNAVLSDVPGVTYTPPMTLKWWRRDNADYALLVSFDARIELNTPSC